MSYSGSKDATGCKDVKRQRCKASIENNNSLSLWEREQLCEQSEHTTAGEGATHVVLSNNSCQSLPCHSDGVTHASMHDYKNLCKTYVLDVAATLPPHSSSLPKGARGQKDIPSLEGRGSKGEGENLPSSGTMCHLLSHRGEWIKEILKRVQDDINISLKRTYSHINLFTYSPYKKAAFTLAEVLITLGIIGVVAAMTIPVLINKTQNKQLEAALKKSYSVAHQALIRMGADRGEIIKAGDFDTWTFAKAYSKYFNTINYCGNTGCVGQTTEEIEGEGSQYVIHQYKSYSKTRAIATDILDDGQFVLEDGTFYMIENPAAWHKKLFISIDVNGYKKGPNAWGHDLFTFQITADGKFLPMGAEGTNYTKLDTYCSISSTNKENGIACAYKALTDPNYWKNLP